MVHYQKLASLTFYSELLASYEAVWSGSKMLFLFSKWISEIVQQNLVQIMINFI